MTQEPYEHFDFNPTHLLPDCMIYSPAYDSVYKISSSMWESLNILAEMRGDIIYYREHIHDGKNIETAEIYVKMLKELAKAKKIIQQFANQFCVVYRGYSLN